MCLVASLVSVVNTWSKQQRQSNNSSEVCQNPGHVWFSCWDVQLAWVSGFIYPTVSQQDHAVDIGSHLIVRMEDETVKDVFIFGFLGILNGGFSLTGLFTCYFKTMLPLSDNLLSKVNKTNCLNRAMESSRETSTDSHQMLNCKLIHTIVKC